MILKMSHTIKSEGGKEPGNQGWIWYDNVLTASCNFDPNLGCKVMTIVTKNQVDKTAIPLWEVAYLLNDEGKTIEAFYPEIAPRDLEQRACSKCMHSHKVDDITYECDAEEYDIDTHSCFVPR
jgi:hypothetical protein